MVQPYIKFYFHNRQIDYTIIELHLHQPGDLGQSETCAGCEPGLRKAEILRQTRLAGETKLENHSRQKEILKSLCGVKRPFNETRTGSGISGRDRAQERRNKFGVDNPYGMDKPASINESIPKSNKGRKMLEKSGWKIGEGLGKNKQGITEPIQEKTSRKPRDQAGIGNSRVQGDSKRDKIKQMTINRYYSIPDP